MVSPALGNVDEQRDKLQVSRSETQNRRTGEASHLMRSRTTNAISGARHADGVAVGEVYPRASASTRRRQVSGHS